MRRLRTCRRVRSPLEFPTETASEQTLGLMLANNGSIRDERIGLGVDDWIFKHEGHQEHQVEPRDFAFLGALSDLYVCFLKQ